MKLDPFYPIFEDAGWCARLLPYGIRLVQLRVKGKSPGETRIEIETARRLCAKHNCQLIVNDYWQLAIELKCNFVHLGQEDLEEADVAAIRRAGIRIGISTHDDAELERALSVEPDYVALGPVFPTILKKMKWHEQGLPKVTEWKSRIGDVPLVAIGGLTPERGRAALKAGADIVSVVTDITLNQSPEQRVETWLAETRELAA